MTSGTTVVQVSDLQVGDPVNAARLPGTAASPGGDHRQAVAFPGDRRATAVRPG